MKAEAAHFAKKNGVPVDDTAATEQTPKRQLESAPADSEAGEGETEDPEAKRRRILEETRDLDADSDGSEEDSSEEEDSDDDDDEAALMRELEQIKKERLAQKEKEVCGNLILRETRSQRVLILCRNKNGQPKRRSNERSTLLVETHF